MLSSSPILAQSSYCLALYSARVADFQSATTSRLTGQVDGLYPIRQLYPQDGAF